MNDDATAIRAKVGAVLSNTEHMQRKQHQKRALAPIRNRLRSAAADAAAAAAAATQRSKR